MREQILEDIGIGEIIKYLIKCDLHISQKWWRKRLGVYDIDLELDREAIISILNEVKWGTDNFGIILYNRLIKQNA